MTKEDKDLLIKDISMRLPYGVKNLITGVTEGKDAFHDLIGMNISAVEDRFKNGTLDIKLILRPLSDLSDQQLILLGYQEAGIKTLIEDIQQGEICQREYMYLIKNHYDVNLFIERGIAVDVNTIETDPYK